MCCAFSHFCCCSAPSSFAIPFFLRLMAMTQYSTNRQSTSTDTTQHGYRPHTLQISCCASCLCDGLRECCGSGRRRRRQRPGVRGNTAVIYVERARRSRPGGGAGAGAGAGGRVLTVREKGASSGGARVLAAGAIGGGVTSGARSSGKVVVVGTGAKYTAADIVDAKPAGFFSGTAVNSRSSPNSPSLPMSSRSRSPQG